MDEQEQFEAWWKEDCDTTMNPYSNTSMMYWAWEAWKAGRKVEREACAKLCDDLWRKGGWDHNAGYAADKIRLRGQDV